MAPLASGRGSAASERAAEVHIKMRFGRPESCLLYAHIVDALKVRENGSRNMELAFQADPRPRPLNLHYTPNRR